MYDPHSTCCRQYDNFFYGLIDNLCDFLMYINSNVMFVLSDDEHT
jgi:hypothetical protein